MKAGWQVVNAVDGNSLSEPTALRWVGLTLVLMVSALAFQWYGADGRQPRGLSNHRPTYKLDINVASRAQWEALPQIGPTLAQRIVEHRQLVGAFDSIDQLIEVRGMGQRTLAQIRDYLTCDPSAAVPRDRRLESVATTPDGEAKHGR
ncbi:MAG: hypothetical protein KatS3mg111_3243 [Pirellulaceae bacterium]|nr:MAG: hypothetical protein KatS3mg111_3243 [Pirellulaceae bacterium]